MLINIILNCKIQVRVYLNISVYDWRLIVMKLGNSFTHITEHSEDVRLAQPS